MHSLLLEKSDLAAFSRFCIFVNPPKPCGYINSVNILTSHYPLTCIPCLAVTKRFQSVSTTVHLFAFHIMLHYFFSNLLTVFLKLFALRKLLSYHNSTHSHLFYFILNRTNFTNTKHCSCECFKIVKLDLLDIRSKGWNILSPFPF